MEILSGVASKLGELLVDATINQARYLLCFNSINKELKVKETKLKEAQDGINKRVEQERQIHRAIEVEEGVKTWLEDVDKEMADVRNLKAKIDEKKSCLNGWCPNWGWRYWLGRKASKKSSKLSELQHRCKFSSVAGPKPLPSDKELHMPRHFMSFGTTESTCNQIIEALKRDSTTMVGLYGVGGVGKTTLANFVGNQLRQEKIFDEVGIATVSQDPDIIKVQGELANSLGWKLMEKDEKERADRLRLMFSESKSSKILIILDDVWNELDLKTVGIPVGDGDNCCKILLTTRLQPVCDRMGCDKRIQLGVLKPEEGLALLRKHAGIDVADSTLIGVSERVADECKGLPLAIKAVGSALRDKRFDEWNLALNKLRDAKLNTIEGVGKEDQGVYHCLKFSYDYLNGEDSRSCFLLCSLFPEDYEIYLDDLVAYAVGLRWYRAESIEKVRSLLSGTMKEVKASSLLLDTGNDRSVKMHDVVRDVAIWISKKKEEEEERFFSITGIEMVERAMEDGLEQCRGMSLVVDKKEEELPSSLICPKLHILRLENTVYNYELQMPEHFFKGMPALKVVTIIGGVLSLKSLQSLTNLQVLQLIRCKVSDASFLGKLKRLQILFLKNIGIIGCYNIVPSIDERGFNELTCLDVRDCEDLECIMEASKSPHGKSLSRLAELSMWDLPELKWIWKAPAQHVISLQTLIELNVHRCNKLTYIFTLSQARSLEQLKSLHVSGCERLKCIVEAKSDHNEREISVGDGNTILVLPLLRKLTLYDLQELISFCSENYYSTWPALEELYLKHCPNLTVSSTELEANLQYLEENLKILFVDNCSHLSDTIPALLKHGLKNLEYLRIGDLGVQVVFQLEAIIAEGEENKLLPRLKWLVLEENKLLKKFWVISKSCLAYISSYVSYCYSI